MLKKARIFPCEDIVFISSLSRSLTQVLEYCEHHRGERLPTTDAESQDETRKRTTDISEWDQKFIAVDQEMLFEIILAANYLDIKPLLSVLCPLHPKHP